MNSLEKIDQGMIYVVGHSCTGKTTLCHALANHLTKNGRSVNLYPEIGGGVLWEMATEAANANGGTIRSHRDALIKSVEPQFKIIEAVYEREHTIALRAQSSISIHDRSAIDAIVYGMTSTDDKDEKDRLWQQLAGSPQFQDLLQSRYTSSSTRFILLTTIPEWIIQDETGRRGRDGIQHEDMYRHVLTELGIEFTQIGKEMSDLSDRVQAIMEIIDKIT